jgi:hypothetical protein
MYFCMRDCCLASMSFDPLLYTIRLKKQYRQRDVYTSTPTFSKIASAPCHPASTWLNTCSLLYACVYMYACNPLCMHTHSHHVQIFCTETKCRLNNIHMHSYIHTKQSPKRRASDVVLRELNTYILLYVCVYIHIHPHIQNRVKNGERVMSSFESSIHTFFYMCVYTYIYIHTYKTESKTVSE